MNTTQAEIDAMLSPQSLTTLLAQAIHKVRIGEAPADILAQTIMVAIQAEVSRAKMELVIALSASFKVRQ